MPYTIDITAKGFSLANARECARAAADAYSATPTFTSPLDGTRVIVTDCTNCLVVAIQGTANLRQWITDAKAWRKRVDSYGVHAGFYASAASVAPTIRSIIKPDCARPIIVTGHSLGGALAQMIGWYLAGGIRPLWIHSIYTFGGPRIGDANAVSMYDRFTGTNLPSRTYRVTNGADIVPWLPGWLLGYRHTPQEYFMSSIGGLVNGPSIVAEIASDLPEIIREYRRGHLAALTDHFIQSYIDRLAKLS